MKRYKRDIESFEKLLNSKLSKKESRNKFSDTFNSNRVEVFEKIPSGIEIPDSFKSKRFEDFRNEGFSVSSCFINFITAFARNSEFIDSFFILDMSCIVMHTDSDCLRFFLNMRKLHNEIKN